MSAEARCEGQIFMVQLRYEHENDARQRRLDILNILQQVVVDLAEASLLLIPRSTI